MVLVFFCGVRVSSSAATSPQAKGIDVDEVSSNHLRWRAALERYWQEHQVVPNLATLARCFKDPWLRFTPRHSCPMLVTAAQHGACYAFSAAGMRAPWRSQGIPRGSRRPRLAATG